MSSAVTFDRGFYTLGPSPEFEGEVWPVQYGPLEGTNGQTKIPIAGPLSVKFRSEGNMKSWPNFFAGEIGGRFHFYAKSLADEIIAAGFSGIEFHPVRLSFGDLRKLKGKEAECPEYVWARVTGIVFLNYFYEGKPLKTDEKGMVLLEKPPLSRFPDLIIRDEQPQMLDFNRTVPGNGAEVILSPRAAEFLGGRLDRKSECVVVWLDLQRVL